LNLFRLPGEAQRIDRLMEGFSEQYFVHNPGSIFKNASTVYVMAFSAIMLNTDAHNPAIRKQNKMTKKQFFTSNRGMNDGENFPEEYLSDLYDRIVNNEIKMDTPGGNAEYANADRRGFLYKQSGRMKAWKRQWFILMNNCLYYFNSKNVWHSLTLCCKL
jgi:Sec7-like guanine-nucleotide exchange factor